MTSYLNSVQRVRELYKIHFASYIYAICNAMLNGNANNIHIVWNFPGVYLLCNNLYLQCLNRNKIKSPRELCGHCFNRTIFVSEQNLKPNCNIENVTISLYNEWDESQTIIGFIHNTAYTMVYTSIYIAFNIYPNVFM